MLFPIRSKRVTALALGGGAAHGLAHIGVIQVLEEYSVKIDMVTGTSAGSIVGALWSAGYSADELYDIARKIKKSDIMRLTLSSKGLFSISGIRKIVNEYIPHDSFRGIQKPFGCVATEFVTGAPGYLKKGKLSDSIAASCAVPAVFKPVRIGKKYYMDGGLCENVPAAMARTMGATAVIGVSLNNYYELNDKPDNVFEIMAHSVYLMGQKVKQFSDEGDIIITPKIEVRDYTGLDNLDEYVELGRKAALDKIKAIKSPFFVRRKDPV